MATHLIVIPGFGMNGSDMGMVEGPDGNCQRIDHLYALSPDWQGSSGLADVAEKLALQIDGIYQAAPEPRSFVVYGFSLGGDLLMEMVNRNLLSLGCDSVLILADPNVSGLTCFVTRLAKFSAGRTAFLDAVTAHANGPGGMQRANWFKYQASVDANIVSDDWGNFQQVAESVLLTVDKRYAEFIATVALTKATLMGARIKLLLSEDGKKALMIEDGCLFAGEDEWFECPEHMQHFGLSDQGTINQYVEQALAFLNA